MMMAKLRLEVNVCLVVLLVLPDALSAVSSVASSSSSGATSAALRPDADLLLHDRGGAPSIGTSAALGVEPQEDVAASVLAIGNGKLIRHAASSLGSRAAKADRQVEGALEDISSADDAASEEEKLTLGNKLGEGAFGQVFLVTIDGCSVSTPIAVKRQKGNGFTPLVKEYDREVEALEKFKDFPDFVHILGHKLVSDMMKGDFCMIATQAADTDLEKWKKTQAASPSQWDLTIQLAAAVKRMHDAGNAHRDIKPGNIFLLNELGHILMGDLALLCNLKETPSSKLYTCGSVYGGDPFFLPPELSRKSNAAKDEIAHDLWSLGITLCWVLSEKPAEIMKDSEPQNTDDEAFKSFETTVLAKETDDTEKQHMKFRFARGMRCLEEARKLEKTEIGELIDFLLKLDPEERKTGFKSWVEKQKGDIDKYVGSLKLDPALRDQAECLAKEPSTWATALNKDMK